MRRIVEGQVIDEQAIGAPSKAMLLSATERVLMALGKLGTDRQKRTTAARPGDACLGRGARRATQSAQDIAAVRCIFYFQLFLMLSKSSLMSILI